MTTTQDNKPVKQFRSINGISASVWKRTSKDGEVFYTTSLDRSYREGDVWKRTSNFRHEELTIVRKLAAKAEAFIDELLLDDDDAA